MFDGNGYKVVVGEVVWCILEGEFDKVVFVCDLVGYLFDEVDLCCVFIDFVLGYFDIWIFVVDGLFGFSFEMLVCVNYGVVIVWVFVGSIVCGVDVVVD